MQYQPAGPTHSQHTITHHVHTSISTHTSLTHTPPHIHTQLWQHPETATAGLADLSSGLSNWFTSTLAPATGASPSTKETTEEAPVTTKPSRVCVWWGVCGGREGSFSHIHPPHPSPSHIPHPTTITVIVQFAVVLSAACRRKHSGIIHLQCSTNR